MRLLAKSIAAAAHERDAEEPPAAEVGAKAFRVGGATDGRARLGDRSEAVLKQRGRWESDVALIYQRPRLAEQLALRQGAEQAAGLCADAADERACEIRRALATRKGIASSQFTAVLASF